MTGRLLPALLLLLAAGCAQNSQNPQTPVTSAARQAAAIEANRKGEAYVRHGELENAARSYAEALRLSQSLEDAEGIAANAINLSIVRQRQGRFADARAALAASRSASDRAETANAMRILGVTALRSGDAAAARSQLEQALALDREIGAPRKIAFDLVALGRAAALGGDREGARAFYARALAVSEADRDSVAAAEARALLEAVDKAATGK